MLAMKPTDGYSDAAPCCCAMRALCK
jgi:hypothetical protein